MSQDVVENKSIKILNLAERLSELSIDDRDLVVMIAERIVTNKTRTATTTTGTPKKRHRRTKAEMEASRAQKDLEMEAYLTQKDLLAGIKTEGSSS